MSKTSLSEKALLAIQSVWQRGAHTLTPQHIANQTKTRNMSAEGYSHMASLEVPA